MKFNMGCGHNKLQGYLNVDRAPECAPDEVWNLEKTPWPWQDCAAEEVVFNHSLEHLGGDPEVFLAIMKELYRISAPGAVIKINAPHPRHDNFLGDPTHVRIISPQVLSLFSKKLNDEWQRIGAANSPLAHYTGVDFEIASVVTNLDEPYSTLFEQGKISGDEIMTALKEKNNVASEFAIELKAVKEG